MAVERFTTANAPAPSQYERWRAAVGSTHEAWDMPARPRGAFHGTVDRLVLGDAEVLRCEADPCSGSRGAAELARTDRAALGVLFILEGRERLRHRDRDTVIEAGSLTVWDTTRPLGFEVPARLRKLTLLLPAERVEAWRPARPVGATFDATRGCGALALAQLKTLLTMPTLGRAEEDVALEGIIGLLTATLGGRATKTSAALLRRAEAFIRARLADPSLSVESVARGLGVSRRHLDRAFAASGRSVARFIWGERLARCRRDLTTEREARVSEIAFRWGFSDAGHFSRAFRSAFGVSPSGFRKDRSSVSR